MIWQNCLESLLMVIELEQPIFGLERTKILIKIISTVSGPGPTILRTPGVRMRTPRTPNGLPIFV